MCNSIYFDNAATTFPKPEEVYQFMDKFYRENGVNAGRGSYKMASKATELVTDTRIKLADLINCSSNECVIFTPSATIALNQILNGLEWEEIKTVYVTPFEHNAVMRTINYVSKLHNIEIIELPFDNITFELNVDKVKVMFAQKQPDLIIFSHVSNVTGYILPVQKIVDLSEKYNCTTIMDCSQSLGLVDINIKKLKVDFIVFAGHKTLYGPFGIGGYYNLSNIKLKPYIVGGTGSDSTNLEMPDEMPYALEAGSYNIQAVAGLNAALTWISKIGRENIYTHKKQLSDDLVEALQDRDIECYVPKDLENHIGIVSFNIEGFEASDIGKILDDEFNIAVRTGHHCAPRIGAFLGESAEHGVIRASVGYFNSEKEIQSLSEALEEISEG